MDQLKQIEEYASLLLPISFIARRCGLDESQLRREIRGAKSELAQAYFRGKDETTIKLRKMGLEMALAGSPQAEALMIEHMDNMKSNE